MTSLAVRLNEKFRSSTITAVLEYLDEPDSTTDARGQKKIQDLVTNILNGCWPKTVFYLPLPGKPDPRLPLNPLKPRSRVLQLGQKEDTCLYYALKRIRMHVGKKPTEQYKHFRMIEKRASNWRKGVTQINKECGWKLDFAQMNPPGYGPVTKKNIAAVLKQVDKLIQQPEAVEDVRSLYKEFSQSNCDTLLHFAEKNYYTELYKHHWSYLSSHDSPLPSAFNEQEDLSLQVKVYLLDNRAFKVNYENYGLKHSAWHPTQPIEELGKQIEDHGPHVIVGFFGRTYYEEKPFDTTRKIEGRSVYGWHRNAKRTEDHGIVHGIVLVGVGYDKNLVFFIDPANPSDPKKPLQEEIYVISYDNLKRNITPLDGNQDTYFGIRKLVSKPYAIHGDPELARL